uniref:Calcium/proton exchanger (ChaA, CAX) n=2 Tax=environmental samples TaxID=68359 RepID=A0A075FXX5_9EURY|nr:Calcium/proton exchanger (chaA, CAX) [uncultured marine group II/III euryarchaeote AD1000_23_G03]AIE96208.1 Calcium/proton exchanger (chaA, CAX) [uncultured marine group II/III euryarchaeote AD1000_74_G12]
MSNDTVADEQMFEGWEGMLDAINPIKVKLNVLLIAIPITLYFAYVAHDPMLTFVFSMVAIMPLAFLMGQATEQIALRTSESVGGLLNATFGNAAEMIIAGMAIFAAAEAYKNNDISAGDDMVQIVRASLIGSILGNLLLVMGLAFVWGGIHHKEQRFSTTAVGANGSLLLLAVITLTMPTAYVFTMQDKGAAAEGVMALSHAAAIILIGLYGLFLLFQLRTHQELFATDGAHSHEAPKMSQREAIVLLLGATVILGWMAEILVHSIAEGAEELNLSPLFIGVILVPFFGNAAEHFTAVTVAKRDKMDLSFGIAVGSSTQIAVFVAPLMVLLAWLVGVDLSFEFGLFETIAVFLSVLIANAIASDGKSNWLEGAMLLGTYAIMAAAFFLH